MKKIITLTESELIKLVKRVIEEQQYTLKPIKIKLIDDKTKQTLLFNIFDKSERDNGCSFYGKFRGGYDKILQATFPQFAGGDEYELEFECYPMGTYLSNNDIRIRRREGVQVDSSKLPTMRITDTGKGILQKRCGCNKYASTSDKSPESSSETYV